MKFNAQMTVDPNLASFLEDACRRVEGECEGTLFDREVIFANGNRAAVRVVEVAGETAWSECVIFSSDGHELSCSDVSECFLGEFALNVGDDEYFVNVIAA